MEYYIDLKAVEELKGFLGKRTNQIIRKGENRISPLQALKVAETDVENSMYAMLYLRDYKDRLNFDPNLPLNVLHPAFEVVLGLVCGLQDGWIVEEIEGELKAYPKAYPCQKVSHPSNFFNSLGNS